MSAARSAAGRPRFPTWRIATIFGVPVHLSSSWLVLAASLALLVWLAYARAPWGFALLAVAASAWALLTLVRRLPQERGEQPPEV